MHEIELIEKQVERLDDKSFAQFRDWFFAYEHGRWDHKVEPSPTPKKPGPYAMKVVGLAETGR